MIGGRTIQVTSRSKFGAHFPTSSDLLPALAGELECVVVIDGRYAATLRFRDESRAEGKSSVSANSSRSTVSTAFYSCPASLKPRCATWQTEVGMTEVFASQSPEQKLLLVREETKRVNSLFMGDGINDALALTAATVGIAFGQESEVTAEAAGVVILDNSLERVDELLHFVRRMQSIALQSAVGGIGLSMIGMFIAAARYLLPVVGASTQEVIDVLAVLNAPRTSMAPRMLSDSEPLRHGDAR